MDSTNNGGGWLMTVALLGAVLVVAQGCRDDVTYAAQSTISTTCQEPFPCQDPGAQGMGSSGEAMPPASGVPPEVVEPSEEVPTEVPGEEPPVEEAPPVEERPDREGESPQSFRYVLIEDRTERSTNGTPGVDIDAVGVVPAGGGAERFATTVADVVIGSESNNWTDPFEGLGPPDA
ncbi:MAG: hypothetical protein AAFS10_23785, partial [Myxococcota bacterium]